MDDGDDMFPLCELVTHVEAAQPKSGWVRVLDSRRSPRRPRFGTLTVYPHDGQPQPPDAHCEEPRAVVSLSNVSGTGIGIVHDQPLPVGSILRTAWRVRELQIPVRFRVVHSQVVARGIYRTGAKLMIDDEPAVQPADEVAPMAAPPPIEPTACATSDGVMSIEPSPATDHIPGLTPAPADVVRMPGAVQLVKAERLSGITPYGFERELEICRIGDRLWLYIHSPGKRNGWGIYLDPGQLGAALARLATEPAAGSLAA